MGFRRTGNQAELHSVHANRAETRNKQSPDRDRARQRTEGLGLGRVHVVLVWKSVVSFEQSAVLSLDQVVNSKHGNLYADFLGSD